MKCSAYVSMFCIGKEPAVAMLGNSPVCERCRRYAEMQGFTTRPMPSGWVARALTSRLPMRVTGGSAA